MIKLIYVVIRVNLKYIFKKVLKVGVKMIFLRRGGGNGFKTKYTVHHCFLYICLRHFDKGYLKLYVLDSRNNLRKYFSTSELRRGIDGLGSSPPTTSISTSASRGFKRSTPGTNRKLYLRQTVIYKF